MNAGARIIAIVGTSTASVEEARLQLARDCAIDCVGYTDLGEAMRQQPADAVALCSPWRFHAQQLELVAGAGLHCLVEKPLVWPAVRDEVDSLVAQFEQRELLLQMVAQWPCTLTSFAALHGTSTASSRSFRMRLSPISIGPDMVTDSAPHFLSMLHALWGAGRCDKVRVEYSPRRADRASLCCEYQHRGGVARAELLLQTCEQRPRPAWYEIDGRRVAREVELPAYRQFFSSGERRVALADPLQQVVEDFLSRLAGGARTDGALLRGAHDNLMLLAAAWPQA